MKKLVSVFLVAILMSSFTVSAQAKPNPFFISQLRLEETIVNVTKIDTNTYEFTTFYQDTFAIDFNKYKNVVNFLLYDNFFNINYYHAETNRNTVNVYQFK